MIETISDTKNSMTVGFAVDEYFEAARNVLPVMLGATIVDSSGRTRSGQTPEEFFTSVKHARQFTAGINWALDVHRRQISTET